MKNEQQETQRWVSFVTLGEVVGHHRHSVFLKVAPEILPRRQRHPSAYIEHETPIAAAVSYLKTAHFGGLTEVEILTMIDAAEERQRQAA